jgi:chemotaxis protein methyltransferase CheR
LQDILAIRDLVSDEAGLHFGESRLHLLENCVKRRMEIVGLKSASEYYNILVSGNLAKKEMTELVSIATTQETSFMRIPEHFQALREEEIPRLVKMRQKNGENYIHIWSAGTATGEEAYSLAITTLSTGIVDSFKPMIVGTDIDPQALTHAREGIYKPSRMKNLSPTSIWSHFEKTDETFKVKDSTRNLVTFFTHNLVSDHQIFDQDIIFCRNVTIYFSLSTRLEVLGKLAGCLVKGGVMMLGEAEIMPSGVPGLEPRSFKNSLYYVKTGGTR